jgi:hypothetical protein
MCRGNCDAASELKNIRSYIPPVPSKLQGKITCRQTRKSAVVSQKSSGGVKIVHKMH